MYATPPEFLASAAFCSNMHARSMPLSAAASGNEARIITALQDRIAAVKAENAALQAAQ
jgi:hypothetical protein